MKSLVIGFCGGAGIAQNTGATRYWVPVGYHAYGTTEAPYEVPVRAAGKFTDLSVRIASTTFTVSSNATATLRKSRASTSLVVSWAANQTGTFTDATDVSVADTDEFCIEVALPSETGKALNISTTLLTFDSDDSVKACQALGAGGGSSCTTASTTWYWLPTGRVSPWSSSATDENYAKWYPRTGMTLKNLYAYVYTARATTNTLKSRKNGADGGMSVSLTGGTTGAFEDASGSDALTSSDYWCLALTTGTGTDSLVFSCVSVFCVSDDGYVPYITFGNYSLTIGSTRYMLPVGHLTVVDTTESNTQIVPPFTMKLKDFQGYTSNTSASATLGVRDNGADGNESCAWSSEGGLKWDSSNEDEITGASDTLNLQFVNTGATSFAIRWTSVLGSAVSSFIAKGRRSLTFRVGSRG